VKRTSSLFFEEQKTLIYVTVRVDRSETVRRYFLMRLLESFAIFDRKGRFRMQSVSVDPCLCV